jgi:hypothetical protein
MGRAVAMRFALDDARAANPGVSASGFRADVTVRSKVDALLADASEHAPACVRHLFPGTTMPVLAGPGSAGALSRHARRGIPCSYASCADAAGPANSG